MPTVAQQGVSNFFENLGEIRNFYNSVLQGKGGQAMTAFGRFLTNTTIGIGLFDPATSMGLAQKKRGLRDNPEHLGRRSRTICRPACTWA